MANICIDFLKAECNHGEYICRHTDAYLQALLQDDTTESMDVSPTVQALGRKTAATEGTTLSSS